MQASKQARGHAFSEVVVQIDDALSQGIYSFKLGELYRVYEQRIKYFIPDATVNKTLFKGELLDHLSSMECKNILMEDVLS